ncbi:MAG: BlaI/MecI/CopY family transcriptional regulator [Gemmatimonadetes bacterium]|nr:BlaI/MecI/CopY family transcriptional regulator [Gemmatimonadota bacterium]
MAASKKPAARAAATPKLQDTVRLSADGLAKVLGDLEARVLRVVWALGRPATARDVHARVVRAHQVSPLTTITVLNRLVAKHVLTRTRTDDRLHYAARLDERAFMTHASRRVMEGIVSLGPDAVAASLVDVLAERDPRQLEELARLVRRKLRERGER